jgi:hypothetical protein
MPRYVVLEHDHPELHWDLMLEAGDVLQTWRLANPPAPGCAIEATALPDHRRIYLDYEGPVSGNRGNVKRWDAGCFTEAAASTAEHRVILVDGTKLRGSVDLQRVEGAIWRFVWNVNGD